MTEIDKVSEARNWKEYYNAYGTLYEATLRSRWALGSVSMAGHIHDVAIPDVSGQLVGGLSWAAYSQPSAKTLVAFLGLFRELIEREPHRASANRYCFFCLNDDLPTGDQVSNALDSQAVIVSYSVTSFEAELQAPEWTGPLRGFRALCGIDTIGDMYSGGSIKRLTYGAKAEFDKYANLVVKLSSTGMLSFVDALVARSSLLLAGYKAGVAVSDITSVLGASVAVAAIVAERRAHLSGWGPDAVGYVRQVSQASPPEFEIHKVQPGEILGRIVREKYKVPFTHLWPVISALNPEIGDPNRIIAGREIKLPLL